MPAPDRADADWREAFRVAASDPPQIACPHVTGHADPDHPCVRGISTRPFTIDDVEEFLSATEGRPHHAPWTALVRLRDGRFASIRATCCGEGWRCHTEGSASVARHLAFIISSQFPV
jgi:hypothetical protein